MLIKLDTCIDLKNNQSTHSYNSIRHYLRYILSKNGEKTLKKTGLSKSGSRQKDSLKNNGLNELFNELFLFTIFFVAFLHKGAIIELTES